jgi:hypothetical protein
MTEHTYRWRVIDRGKPRVTLAHLAEAQVRRDYPECEPEPLLDTLRPLQVPSTDRVMIDLLRSLGIDRKRQNASGSCRPSVT